MFIHEYYTCTCSFTLGYIYWCSQTSWLLVFILLLLLLMLFLLLALTQLQVVQRDSWDHCIAPFVCAGLCLCALRQR